MRGRRSGLGGVGGRRWTFWGYVGRELKGFVVGFGGVGVRLFVVVFWTMSGLGGERRMKEARFVGVRWVGGEGSASVVWLVKTWVVCEGEIEVVKCGSLELRFMCWAVKSLMLALLRIRMMLL